MNNLYGETNAQSPHVFAFARGDVTGDRTLDTIYLTGATTSDSPYVQNITLLIQNGSTGAFMNIPLQENAGYDPTIFLGDFTGNGVDDIFISINSGGSGGIMYHYIYSFVNNQPQLIFDFNVYNDQYQYTVTYKDNYKVEVVSLINKQMYIIDISTRDPDYLSEIYDNNGKLISPISGFVNPLSGLYPVDFDYDQKYELLAFQKIAGRYNADSLGYVLNTLAWNGNAFILENQDVAIFGSDLE